MPCHGIVSAQGIEETILTLSTEIDGHRAVLWHAANLRLGSRRLSSGRYAVASDPRVGQCDGVNPGRLVMLNGVSSAGKTTLATAFRDERAPLGDFWMLIGIDDALAKLPSEWMDLGLVTGPGGHHATAGPELCRGRGCHRLPDRDSPIAGVTGSQRLGVGVARLLGTVTPGNEIVLRDD